MGILKNLGIGSKPKGYQCSPGENGETQVCDVFEVNGNSKVATSSHIEIGMDRNSCEPFLTGQMNSVLETDRETVKQIMADMKSNCKRGIA